MNFIEEKVNKRKNTKFRFPPEPNAPGLHLGHAKSMCLNFGLANTLGSECILRFDDTNPVTENIDYINGMIDDVKWLGFTPSEISYTSDHFDEIYECAVTLIKKGLAYVEYDSPEEIASKKGTTTKPGTNSVCRNNSIEENVYLFNKMKEGGYGEKRVVLRAKIDMASPNMIMRDPVLYRIIDTPHHRTGDKWCIYPMYDMAHPLCDYFEGITDSLCTLEFEVHRPLYNWILNNSGLSGNLPEETEFSRLNVKDHIMSKRKFNSLSEEGKIEGWDDPRLLTLAGLKKRGFTPSSIRDFCDRVGVSKRESVIDIELLEECLRIELNETANRVMGVFDHVKVTISNWPGDTEYVSIENNPGDDTKGVREVPFNGTLYIEKEDFREEANRKYHRLKLGHEVRLKGAYIIKAESVIKDENGEVTEIICTYDPDTKSGKCDRKVKGTIHWVSAEHGVIRPVYEYDKPFEDGEFIEDSRTIKPAIFEPHILDLEIGENVQMMRKGYYTMSDGYFIKIVGLRSSFKI
jgi:glutaminyl-tRNA synthetase